jgi:Zn-dependent protease with chaperone function
MELCERLPWWEGSVGPALAFLVPSSLMLLAFGVVVASARRRLAAPELHWSVRARIAVEHKTVVIFVGMVAVVLLVLCTTHWVSASGCSRTVPWGLAGACVVVTSLFLSFGAVDASYRRSRQSLGARLRSLLTISIVYQPGFLVLFAALVASSLAPLDGWIWAWVGGVGLAFLVANTGILYGLARPLGLSWPARREVVEAVERARAALPTKLRAIDELAWLMPNALALPLRRVVVFTKPAADGLSADALHAIALHELGHLHEGAFTRWFRVVRGLALLPYAVAIPLLESERSTALLVLFAGALALGVSGIFASRSHEKDADAHAAHHSPAYARALETLYRLAGIPATLSRATTHPSLYDRMVAAGATPDFPRPKPPRGWLPLLVLAVVPVFAFVAALGTNRVRAALAKPPYSERAALLRVAFAGKDRDLLGLARVTRDAELGTLLRREFIRRSLAERRPSETPSSVISASVPARRR